jgi:iron complex outermembrane receptor protein
MATMVGAVGTVSAQDAQPASPNVGLEEVVVTATRREESIRDVPISISAFSQVQMDVQGMRGVDDVARLAPGILFTRSSGFGSDLGNTISIRGVSSPAGQATTGIYIDDTPIQVGAVVASGNFADNAYPRLFDVERVEVLRGPQGTLFGSGSEGGTIRFITPAPSLTKASVYTRSEVSSTQYGAPSYEIGAAGGTPIVQDKLGFRASAWHRRDGGYVDSVDYYTGRVLQENNNYTDSTSARLAFAWAATDNLTITPSVYYQYIEANGSSAFYLPSDGLTGTTPGGVTLPVFVQPYGDVGDGEYVDIHQSPQWGKQQLTLPAVKVDYDFGDIALVSNTSYYERKQSQQTDFGFFQAGVFAGVLFPHPVWASTPAVDHQNNRFFTQEVRLQSTDPQSRLRWVAGGFYSRTKTSFDRTVFAPFLGEMIAVGPLGNGCSPASQCVLNLFRQPLHNGQNPFLQFSSLEETQKAVFGQVDFSVTEQFIATVGVRYADLTNDFANAFGGSASGVPFPTLQNGSADSSAVTPKFMLSYKGGDALVYASATKGFRGGGSNAPLASRAACDATLQQLGLTSAPLTFDADSVWSYELGSKFALADGRLQVDVSVFQIDWEDQIRNLRLTNCTQSFTTNVGKTQSRGFDLAVQWRALDSLLLSVNGGYQSVKVEETVRLGAVNAVTEGDYLPGTQPRANAAAQYSFDMMERPAYFRVDFSYTGKAKKDDTFNPLNSGYNRFQLFEDPSFTETNVRLGASFGDWDVSLFVNNLFNEQPILNETRQSLTFFAVPSGLLSATTLRPRTAGVTAVMRF